MSNDVGNEAGASRAGPFRYSYYEKAANGIPNGGPNINGTEHTPSRQIRVSPPTQPEINLSRATATTTSRNIQEDDGDEDDDKPNLPPKPKLHRRRSTGASVRRRPRPEPPPASKEMHLKVPEVDDDYYGSEAEMSGLDDYYRSDGQVRDPVSSQAGPSRFTRPKARSQLQGSDSDSCEDGICAPGGAPEVYDSDLESVVGDITKAAHAKKMRRWKSLAKDKFEKMLLDCIVDIDSIPADYKNMFIDERIIKRLESVTRMSLTRPEAFSHGVLAGNKVTGAILWGPPGTGKTLLAKGVARQSGFNMILASTAELWQKCHGEDEKVIKALFSMARKLHPTIVFIDEADAMLGSRKAGEKRHIRAMINQFLMEWDGLTSGPKSPFILLATNRPFDLDPAVLRRAPIQIHLDIPTGIQRLGILRLLLTDNGEKLAPDVTLEVLAKMTQRYTGSDLKNMCVVAATRCVEEQKEDTKVRTVSLRHFRAAITTVKATTWSKTMENDLQNFKDNAMQRTQNRNEDE